MGKRQRRIDEDALSLYETAIIFTITDDCDVEELFDVLEAFITEQSSTAKKLCKKNKIKNKRGRR